MYPQTGLNRRFRGIIKVRTPESLRLLRYNNPSEQRINAIFITAPLNPLRAGFVCDNGKVKFIIPIPTKISTNKIYAGVHFRQRMEHKELYQEAVLFSQVKPYTGSFPVHIHYHFKLTGTPLDIDNHSYMEKMLADALVANGVLPDDTQAYIGARTTTAEKIKKGEPDEVVIHISPQFSTS